MASVNLYQYATKTQPEIRDDLLLTLANHLRAQGQPNPNVGENSDYYGLATGLANEICVALANNVVSVDQQMPDTAGGSFLDRWLALFNLQRRGAAGSTGLITPTYSATSTFVVTGSQLTDSTGLRYEVSIGGTYGTAIGLSPQIPVDAVDTGSATNHENGDVLQWVNAPPFVDENAVVGIPGGEDGLEGGFDSEVGEDEPPRARLFAVLQSPPRGGNWSDVAKWCSESTPVVQAAGIYPILLGPATFGFAVFQPAQVTQPLSSNSKTRQIIAPTVSGLIVPYVRGQVPENMLVVGTSTVDQPTDVALILTLPSAPTASPPGGGGGWVDGSPWPRSIGGTTPVTVTSVTSSVQITVNATTPPTPGVSHVAWISPLTWQLLTATVTAVSGSSGAYAITLDTPWPGVTAGNFVFPQAVQQQNYLAAILTAFGNLGPGEWTANPTILVRGYRHPLPSLTWPNSIDGRFLRTVEDAGDEVEAARTIYDSSGGATTIPSYPLLTTDGSYTLTSPSTMSPYLLTPRNIAYYQQ